jgi:hypothetical protein
MNVQEIVVARLNKIDVTQDIMAANVTEIKMFIAGAQEREKHTEDCLKRFGSRLDGHDADIKELQKVMNTDKPMISSIRGWIASVIAILTALAISVFVTKAEAAEAIQSHKLSWTMATTRVDGTPLAASEITGVDIRYGSKPVAMANKYINIAKAPALTYTVPTGSPGTYCYQVRTVTAKLKSAWSTEKCADVLALPNPPQITIELVLQVTQ